MATLTTASFNFVSTDDASYRAWLAHVKSVMDTVNPAMLTQTADTGQVDVTTATKPATPSTPHLLVYKFDDGIGLPIYILIRMGVSNASGSTSQMRFSFGTGTDGASNLTGVASELSASASGKTAMDGSGISLACCAAGTLSVVFGQTSSWGKALRGGFTLNRLCDSAGNPIAGGFTWRAWSNYPASSYPNGGVVLYPGFSPYYPTGVAANMVTISTSLQDSINPMGWYGTFSGDYQPSPVFARAPLLRQERLGRVERSVVGLNVEMSIALVGSTPRNYKNLGLWADPVLQYDYLVPWE